MYLAIIVVALKNLFPMTVIEFDLRISFSCDSISNLKGHCSIE